VIANAASQTLKMMKKIIQIMISLSLLLTPDFRPPIQQWRDLYGNVRA